MFRWGVDTDLRGRSTVYRCTDVGDCEFMSGIRRAHTGCIVIQCVLHNFCVSTRRLSSVVNLIIRSDLCSVKNEEAGADLWRIRFVSTEVCCEYLLSVKI